MEKQQRINRKEFLKQSVKVGVAGLTANAITKETAEAQEAGTWCGIDRAKIQWNPVVDEAKCVGCGACVITCPNKVYKYDYTNRKAKVAAPTSCSVGCTACANLCLVSAITHSEGETPRDKAQKILMGNPAMAFVVAELQKRQDELTF
ncbi:4Fe-4S dicluster domain-containing protein [Candidatus Latescibacterota bacterium]